MNFLLVTFWFIWEVKYVLFWLYLWQLKEYHIGRFFDYFRTHNGKKTIFNYQQILKIVLLLFLFDNSLSNFFIVALFLLYFFDFLVIARAILKRSFKKPILTFKTAFLTILSFFTVFAFLAILNFEIGQSFQPVLFLIFDILTPVIISAIVLIFQPFFVLIRNRKIKKAAKKIEEIKNSYKKLKVIAITGSYGKTSTKEFLTAILSKKFKVLSTKEHQNSEIGIANCILGELEKNHQIFIAEVGAYNKGKVREVCNFLKPKFGIVTGVNEQHLALFGSLENLLSAEGGGELANCLPDNGTLFLNGDNKHCLSLYKKLESRKTLNKKIYSFEKKQINTDIWADTIDVYKNHVSFVAINKNGEMMHFNVKTFGKQNIQNLLAAILVAKELGMNFGEIAEGCKNIKPEQSGISLVRGKHGIEIIDSSYSSNPDGVFADLDYLKIFPNKKVIIMPCLIELGKKSVEVHYKIGKKIGEICDMAIITSKDKFREIKKGAMETGMKEGSILLCENPQDIYSVVTLFCKEGDAVLLEGRIPKELINLLK